MLSHNSINDVPAHANEPLMTAMRGWATSNGALFASDMCDVGLLMGNGFGVAKSIQEAAALSMEAGLDQELCNPTDGRGQAFTSATSAIAAGDMKEAVRR
jgi:beta-glucosidase-like glycosyl hydrolase